MKTIVHCSEDNCQLLIYREDKFTSEDNCTTVHYPLCDIWNQKKLKFYMSESKTQSMQILKKTQFEEDSGKIVFTSKIVFSINEQLTIVFRPVDNCLHEH